MEPEPPPVLRADPCLVCGRDTAAGTPYFADRRLVTGSPGPGYMCTECFSIQREGREGPRSEADVRRAVDNAAAAGIRWGGSGGPGFGG